MLTTLVKQKFSMDPFQPENLFLFCGSSNRKIKGLLWEEDGFLFVYKRLEAGIFQWPRTTEEVGSTTSEQYRFLMKGYSIVPSARKVQPRYPPPCKLFRQNREIFIFQNRLVVDKFSVLTSYYLKMWTAAQKTPEKQAYQNKVLIYMVLELYFFF